MNDSEILEVFGERLEVDPSVALRSESLSFPVQKAGPLPKVQFMIEIVGPKSVPAPAALAVLDNPWRSALGDPEVFVMSPADIAWRRPQRPDSAGSFDSMVLAWDYVNARGNLSSNAAARLVQTAESFANGIQRRAMPMPTPPDVDVMVRELLQMRESLDIGFEVCVIGAGMLSEREIWKTCYKLGMELAANGAFVWRVRNSPEPLLSVASWDEGKSFSLSGTQANVQHSVIGCGFNVPTSPDPVNVLQACFHVCETLASALGALVTDDEGVPYDRSKRRAIDDDMSQALEALKRNGLVPGSSEARKLFGNQ